MYLREAERHSVSLANSAVHTTQEGGSGYNKVTKNWSENMIRLVGGLEMEVETGQMISWGKTNTLHYRVRPS